MKFTELTDKLNQLINEQHLDNPHTFDDKDDIKDWLANNIKQIVGSDIIARSYEDDTDNKFKIITPYSGKDNYIEIKYLDYYVCSINFKYTITSHYGRFYRTESDYGIKCVELEKRYNMKSETFEEAKEEIIKEKKKAKIEHLKYLEKQHKEIETFMKEHNITIDEMIKGCELLKDLDYEQHERYEKEFNNSKEARWYNL